MKSIGPNMDQRFGLAVKQAAGNDSSEKDVMVVAAHLTDDFDIEVGQRRGQDRPLERPSSRGRVSPSNASASSLEPATEVSGSGPCRRWPVDSR